MIHAICDICGEDCDRAAYFVTVTPIHNFARYETDTYPFGDQSKTKSSVLCQDCYKKTLLPNPHKMRLTENVNYKLMEQ
jgi:hypothetical protein